MYSHAHSQGFDYGMIHGKGKGVYDPIGPHDQLAFYAGRGGHKNNYSTQKQKRNWHLIWIIVR